jgi:tetratricopeptide (TPR) repeat protein
VRSSEEAATNREMALSRVAWIVALASALGIAFVRPVVAARFHRLRVTADVYPLAPPNQMVVASLGWRAALADAIFAHVLVSYGLHFQEKRRFEFVGDYLDTVNALDPSFREPYRFADTLLVLAPEPARLEHYEKAREIMLRGLERLPYDTELWLTTGQYLAYLAPGNLPTPEMNKAWRLEGGKILARACELASNNGSLPYNCITAATLLNDAGEREAAIRSLQRLIAVTDDPEIERIASGYLEKKLGDRETEKRERRRAAFRDAAKADLPFLSKNRILALGPRTDVAHCAGPGHEEELSCVTTWLDWARLSEPAAIE